MIHDRKPDLKNLHVFGALCYATNDSEDLGMLKPKAEICIFIGYSHAKNAYQIYNKKTRMVMETSHVEFDKLTTMASKQFSSRPAPQRLTPGYISSGLPPSSVVSLVLPAAAPLPADTTIHLHQPQLIKMHHLVSFHHICISSTNHLIITKSRQRIIHWTISLAILLDLFRQELNYKPMSYGATLMHMDIRYHLVENGLVELYSVKCLAEEEEEYR
ncbi:retrovirus-related pol polyprotein from transposon TNT 1-94 [Tanacetum coccineum]|uniref:Retrovirus-related pol polyprotein from transposon TNT 1-94 n=1 Tax=Tanacetum coccineum TaxID=301880 RepID=A0ABQ4Z757_9ASTR